MNLMKQPELMDKARQEISDEIVKKNQGDSKDILDLLNFENVFDLKYYGMCFFESLRI